MDSFEMIDQIIANELSGEITVEEKQELKQWLESDPANVELFDNLKYYWSTNVNMADDDLDDFLKDFRKTFRIKKTIRAIRYPGIASSLALIVTIIFMLTGSFQSDVSNMSWITRGLDPDKNYLILSDGTTRELDKGHVSKEFYTLQGSQPGENKLIVSRRNISSVSLPDGTDATINSMSWLTFPSEFVDGERRVKLSGEAYFDVVEDELNPFVIEIHKGEIVVLGTTLNVMSYENQKSEVTLIEGKVNIYLSGGRDSVKLKPGEQLVISENDYVINSADIENVSPWMDGNFDFAGRPLNEIALLLSKWYGVTITCDPIVSRKILLSGTIERDIPLEELISVIEAVHPVSFEKTVNGYSIKAAQSLK
ncbi:MAG: FecR domain-containing protein [Alistipes sp.]|nr:FecR domain-containing protein [Alistipes sp.]